jgi:hypothetical protein
MLRWSNVKLAVFARLPQILKRRDFYIDALVRPINFDAGTCGGEGSTRTALENLYLWQSLNIELLFRQPMLAVTRCKDVESALRASVFIDRVMGLPWKRCAREDCGQLFNANGRKKSAIYHDEACAHLQAVRSYNNRKPKPESRPVPKKRLIGKEGKHAGI